MVQLAILLVVTILYLIYLRACVPPNHWTYLVAEILSAVCDIATFVCGIVAAKTNPSNISRM